MKQIVSLSGGKDSTAMLHMMLDRGERIDEVIFFDTGWEFPAMIEHINLVEKKTGIKITRLKPVKSFDYWLIDRKVHRRSGEEKGTHYRTGNSWPSATRRWCTRIKINTIQKHLKQYNEYVSCIGFAADEINRTYLRTNGINRRYPLVEWGITEAEALQYCKDKGYDWSGLYEIFHRVSCYCCPLQRIGELKKLRKHYPELWQKMQKMEEKIVLPEGIRGGFMRYKTVQDMENRFSDEDRQMRLKL